MNKILATLIAGVLLLCVHPAVKAQQFTEHINKEFTITRADTATLAIYNIDGPIKVEGYAGDKVVIDVDKTITAEDTATLEQGKQEFKFEMEQLGDSITAFISEPYDSRPHDNYYESRNRDIEYHYRLAFVVKVPFAMSLHISTVNRGNIDVKDVAGKLRVNNVNGAVTISNAKNTTWAHTINGNLTVNYLKAPDAMSDFYTLNGTLTATFPADLSADIRFKTMNGGLYTDFPTFELLPPRLTKSQEKGDNGTIYKLNKDTDVRFGAGGKIFKFGTLNGNVYIKKQS